MIRKRDMKNDDLNISYRPCRIDEMFGQDHAKNMLSNYLLNRTFPHSSLFVGPAGCGKTTAARIVSLGLNCETGITPNPCGVCPTCKSIINQNNLSVLELDGARTRNIDMVRKVLNDLPSSPFGNDRFRVVIFDEAHKLTNDAEDALLKFLEDTPAHVYVILCTNEPEKLKETTRQRCKPIQFNRLEGNLLFEMLEQVAQFEGMRYDTNILKKIVDECEGTPRVALSFLQQINAEGTWTDEAASFILSAGVDLDQQEVIDLGKLLLQSATWSPVRDTFILSIKKIPAENIRISLTGFLAGCLKRAHQFEDAIKYAKCTNIMSDLYYGPKPEHRLLVNLFRCYSILRGKGDTI